MNRVAKSLALCVAMLFASGEGLDATAAAQQRSQRPSTGAPPATRPAGTPTGSATYRDPIVGELDIAANSVKLREFLHMLQQKEPSFQYVTETGPWEDLMLPELHLRDVTLTQVFGMLGRLYPTFPAESVLSNDRPPLFVFGRPRPGGQPDVRVQAFYLSEIVDRLVAKANTAGADKRTYQEKRTEMLKHVLSLVEATIRASANPSSSLWDVSFHADTETVLVRGSLNQTNAVSEALSSFRSGNLQSQIDRLGNQLAEARTQIDELHRELLQREREAAELKVRLEAAQGKKDTEQKH